MLVEHLDGVVGDRPRRVVVTTGEREQVGEREPRFEQAKAGRNELGVVGGEARLAVVVVRDEQPFLGNRLEDRPRDARTRRELVERQRLTGVRLDHRGGQRRVRGIELPVEQPPDDREREALLLELADAGEALQVLVAVEGDAPGAHGWRQRSLRFLVGGSLSARRRRPGGHSSTRSCWPRALILGVVAPVVRFGDHGSGALRPSITIRQNGSVEVRQIGS